MADPLIPGAPNFGPVVTGTVPLDTGATILELMRERDAALAEVSGLREALMPSAATKAAYMGEFKFYDDASARLVTVPWVTIKNIMSAILARALSTSEEQGKR